MAAGRTGPRWRRGRRRRRGRWRGARPRRGRRGRPAPPCAPVSAASGSSTSVRRPVRTSARALGVQAARDGVAEPARRAGEQDGPPGEVHAGNTATVAVNPCRKGSPPTGPISPAAKKPAAGAPASSSSRARASWSGVAEHPAPAAVAGEDERPGGRRAAERLDPQAERVAQVAVGRAGVAGVHPHDRPGLDRRADGDGAVLGVGAEQRADEEVALAVLGLAAVDDHAEQQAVGDHPALGARGAPRSRRAGGRAPGGPRAPGSRCPRTAVTVSSGPTGAAPWDTHGRTSTPSKRTPTAPDGTTRSPMNSAASPSGVRALDRPPRIVTPGDRRPSSASTASVGNV